MESGICKKTGFHSQKICRQRRQLGAVYCLLSVRSDFKRCRLERGQRNGGQKDAAVCFD